MTQSQLRGPALTYVTDGELDRAAQERILNAFLGCAGLYPLRVAFRLPSWTDCEVQRSIEWYENRVESLKLESIVEPPLVHDRPDVADSFQNSMLWLPWRNRDLIGMDDISRVAVSVHSVRAAHEAIFMGVRELFFGHVFASDSHPGEPGKGVDALAELTESIQGYQNPPRVTAIGGIDEHTIPEIGGRGHQSFAAIRAISRSSDVATTVSRILSGWVAARINADLDESQRTPFGNPSSLFF